MPALIEVTGTFPAYQVTVRGTLLEILDVTVDPERSGPRRPVGIASDTGAHLIYLDGDQWVGHLGIVAAPEALPSGRLSVGATYDDSLGNRRRWDGTAWRALGGLSSPDGSTLVATNPIVSPVLSYSQKWAELYAGASTPATYWTPYDPLFIPANSFGPNSPAKRLCINGYFNLRGNTSSAGTWDSVSIGLYLDQAKTWSNTAQKIAGTSLNLPIPAGLSTRYGAFTAELSYLIHEGQTNFTQSLMYSNRIGSMNNWDPNLEVLDSFLENGNQIDWTVDHYLYTSWRVQNGSQTLVIGSRYIEARL